MHQYSPLQLTVAAGTSQAAPAVKAWSPYPGWVHQFRIDIPAGHRALTGVRLVYNGTPVIPFDPALWLQPGGRTFLVPWEDEVDQVGLVVQAYNLDVWPHTFYLWADVNPYLPAKAAGSRGQAARQLGQAATLGQIAQLARTGGGP